MDDNKLKLYAAIGFQYTLLLVLAVAFFMFPSLQEMIGGAFIGLLVGIGIESIKQ